MNAPPPFILRIELEQESDGRWLAEVPELPGAMAYGATREQAQNGAFILALHVIAERIENGELVWTGAEASFPLAPALA